MCLSRTSVLLVFPPFFHFEVARVQVPRSQNIRARRSRNWITLQFANSVCQAENRFGIAIRKTKIKINNKYDVDSVSLLSEIALTVNSFVWHTALAQSAIIEKIERLYMGRSCSTINKRFNLNSIIDGHRRAESVSKKKWIFVVFSSVLIVREIVSNRWCLAAAAAGAGEHV